MVEQKLSSFLQTFPNLKKLEANIRNRKRVQKQAKNQRKPILGGGTTSRGSQGDGGRKVKDIRDYFENLQTSSGTKRKMEVGGVKSEEENSKNSILGSDRKRLKTGACVHTQAARDSIGETSALIGQYSLLNTEQPIRCDDYLYLGSIGRAAADNLFSRPAHRI